MINTWFQRISTLGESDRESALCVEEGAALERGLGGKFLGGAS